MCNYIHVIMSFNDMYIYELRITYLNTLTTIGYECTTLHVNIW